MERLTEKKSFLSYNSLQPVNVVKIDTEEEFKVETMNAVYLVGSAIDKLADYEDAEEKGLLFKMPCNPGDTVFVVISETGEIKEHKVSKVIFGKKHDQIVLNGAISITIWGKNWDEYFNEYIFFTKEEAELSLAKMKEGGLHE